MTSLKIGLLGPLRVQVDDGPVTSFESDRVRALLVYLAVEAHQPHRREALIGLLWPDSPEEAARRNLRQTLYNLRRTIGDHTADPPYLLINREQIQFNPASDYVLDVANFKALVDTCDNHLPRCVEACSIHAARLEQAEALYRGAFLQEFFLADSAEFEEWAVREREALQRRALEALNYLSHFYELREEYDLSLRHARRQLELDPWREEAHRQVMRALAHTGQRSEALAQYESCRRILAKELGVEPSVETQALYEQIRRGQLRARTSDPTAAGAPSPAPLPVSLTPFIGRERELSQLAQLLGDSDCRLVTLVGPGGIGKTRLALAAAVAARGNFAHGAVFVSLAPIDSAALIAPAIADALGLVFAGPLDPKVQLLNYLRGKQLLLLLDNVEHLLEGVGFFRELLEQAPGAKLLVTSREPLNLLGEWLFTVEGLEVPTDEMGKAVEQSSAVALFLQRAQRAQVGFALTVEGRASAVRICRLVGGMPLALELAAAWVRALSLDEIEREIERNLDFLATTLRDLPERHRSMRAVFDQSWRLLSADEQAVLARLSIFRGGFQREAAEAIAGAQLALLSALMGKSFLRRLPSGRFDVHELVRQYAAERLRERPDEESAARSRHSHYYIEFAAREEKELKGARQLAALAETSAEMENIRLAWRYAVTHRLVELVHKPIRAFWSLYEMRGWYQDGHALFRWAADELQRTGDVPVQPDTRDQVCLEFIRSKQGWFAVRLGLREEARLLLEPSTATLRALGAKIELAHALHHLGVLDWQAGDSVRARASFLEELDAATQAGDPWEMALACGNLGIAAQSLGEQREALERYQSALSAFTALGDERMVGVGDYYLGQMQCALGMYTAAEHSLRESIARSRRVGEPWLLGMALSALGDVVTQGGGDVREAVDLYRESLALFEQVGERWSTVETLNQLGDAILSLDHDAEARDVFAEALKLAIGVQLRPGMLKALVGIAQCYARTGQPESAFVILTNVLNESSIAKALRDRADQLRIEVQQKMRPEQVRSALAQALALNLDRLARELQRATTSLM